MRPHNCQLSATCGPQNSGRIVPQLQLKFKQEVLVIEHQSLGYCRAARVSLIIGQNDITGAAFPAYCC